MPNKQVNDFIARNLAAQQKNAVGEHVMYNLGRVANIDCSRAAEVRIILRPANQTIVDTVRYFVSGNWIEKNAAKKQSCVIS